jgi:DNA-directed RNA polymerase specialized sigma24 family protein
MEAPTRTCVPATWSAYEAISDLPPPLREAITAVDVLGLSNRDAANGVAA